VEANPDYVLWSQERSLAAGVNAYFNAKQAAAQQGDLTYSMRLDHLALMANTRGVSLVTTP